jgi:hypothetical protein
VHFFGRRNTYLLNLYNKLAGLLNNIIIEVEKINAVLEVGNIVQKLLTFASIVSLVSTLLVIFLFFNGTDIVEETYFFPTIMLGFLLSIVFGWNIKSKKTKSIILWSIGIILAILFLVQIVFVFLWTSGNP